MWNGLSPAVAARAEENLMRRAARHARAAGDAACAAQLDQRAEAAAAEARRWEGAGRDRFPPFPCPPPPVPEIEPAQGWPWDRGGRRIAPKPRPWIFHDASPGLIEPEGGWCVGADGSPPPNPNRAGAGRGRGEP